VGRYTAVPPIAGTDVNRGTTTLHDAGFGTTTRNKASDTVPVGGVVGTDPPAGTRVVKGSTVAVLVSSGQPQVPQFQAGQDVKSVQQAIRDQGLQPVDGGETPSSAPKGTVVKLDPQPGTVLPTGAAVKVYRSKGTQPVKVPDVKGKSADAATQALTAAGLTVRDTQQQFDRTVDSGAAIGTDPAAGTTLQSGDSVTLLVSNAIRVPDEIGKTASAARAELEGLGLKVAVNRILSDERGTVRVQSPVIGALVEPGSTVTLTILPF
jgi:serine/threonine-protein kinase